MIQTGKLYDADPELGISAIWTNSSSVETITRDVQHPCTILDTPSRAIECTEHGLHPQILTETEAGGEILDPRTIFKEAEQGYAVLMSPTHTHWDCLFGRKNSIYQNSKIYAICNPKPIRGR